MYSVPFLYRNFPTKLFETYKKFHNFTEEYNSKEKASELLVENMIISTITLRGEFENFQFNEKSNAGMIKANKYVRYKQSKYETEAQDGYSYPIKKQKKTNRGRKPKPKVEKKQRKTDKIYNSFDSQCTCGTENTVADYYHPHRSLRENELINEILNDIRASNIRNNIFRIKIFRNGMYGVPGVQRTDFYDVLPALLNLEEVLRDVDEKCKLKLDTFYVDLINCKTIIKDKSLNINTSLLGKIISESEKYKNYIGINEVVFRSNKSANCARIYLLRYKKKKNELKKTSIKVYSKKINIFAASSYEEACEMLLFINFVLFENRDKVFSNSSSSAASNENGKNVVEITDSESEDE